MAQFGAAISNGYTLSLQIGASCLSYLSQDYHILTLIDILFS